jgi:hypothetical protein
MPVRPGKTRTSGRTPRPSRAAPAANALDVFHPPTRAWFERSFPSPTAAQRLAWPALATGESTLLLAPTGAARRWPRSFTPSTIDVLAAAADNAA